MSEKVLYIAIALSFTKDREVFYGLVLSTCLVSRVQPEEVHRIVGEVGPTITGLERRWEGAGHIDQLFACVGGGSA